MSAKIIYLIIFLLCFTFQKEYEKKKKKSKMETKVTSLVLLKIHVFSNVFFVKYMLYFIFATSFNHYGSVLTPDLLSDIPSVLASSSSSFFFFSLFDSLSLKFFPYMCHPSVLTLHTKSCFIKKYRKTILQKENVKTVYVINQKKKKIYFKTNSIYKLKCCKMPSAFFFYKQIGKDRTQNNKNTNIKKLLVPKSFFLLKRKKNLDRKIIANAKKSNIRIPVNVLHDLLKYFILCNIATYVGMYINYSLSKKEIVFLNNFFTKKKIYKIIEKHRNFYSAFLEKINCKNEFIQSVLVAPILEEFEFRFLFQKCLLMYFFFYFFGNFLLLLCYFSFLIVSHFFGFFVRYFPLYLLDFIFTALISSKVLILHNKHEEIIYNFAIKNHYVQFLRIFICSLLFAASHFNKFNHLDKKEKTGLQKKIECMYSNRTITAFLQGFIWSFATERTQNFVFSFVLHLLFNLQQSLVLYFLK